MILDCTLRDGGYYVNWDFDEEIVQKYLAAIAIAKVDVIEIGFRFLSTNKFMGAFAYSTDEYLDSLDLPINIPVSVMINASELISNESGVDEAVEYLFNHKDKSPVDIVRIATRVEDITSSAHIALKLNQLGYRVFLNLMQVDSIALDKLVELAESISAWNSIEVLYFADSFGSMDPSSIKNTIDAIKTGWSGPIGVHAHDNKGLALLNSLAANDAGANYLDSTLCGMGRGAGNVKTEYLLVELMQQNSGGYFPDAVFPLVLHYFSKLQGKYKWGQNIYYYLSAVHGIHPTYIQEMLGDRRYDIDQILSAINFLKSTKAPFFSFENMLRAASGVKGDEKGTWSADGWVDGKSVLILGAGLSVKRYIKALRLFIGHNNPIVLCLNVNEEVPEDIVDFYVACHETRILIESDRYQSLKKPIIIPDDIQTAIANVNMFDYGLRVEEGCFDIFSNGCVLTSPLALAYAISVVTAGGADKIILAGVDGYSSNDPRQIELVEMFDAYRKNFSEVSVAAITPTAFPIKQSSVFEPMVKL